MKNEEKSIITYYLIPLICTLLVLHYGDRYGLFVNRGILVLLCFIPGGNRGTFITLAIYALMYQWCFYFGKNILI
jgi:hypothetical protein